MRINVLSPVIVILLLAAAQPAFGAEGCTLQSTIARDLALLKNNGHGRDFFAVTRTRGGQHAGDVRISTKDFRELTPFQEAAAVDLGGFRRKESSSGNLDVVQWTSGSGALRSIRELTYRENGAVRVKQYIIERERPPHLLSYLSVAGQGLLVLQQDNEIIRVMYESAVSDLGELLQRFDREAKQAPFPYRTPIFPDRADPLPPR